MKPALRNTSWSASTRLNGSKLGAHLPTRFVVNIVRRRQANWYSTSTEKQSRRLLQHHLPGVRGLHTSSVFATSAIGSEPGLDLRTAVPPSSDFENDRGPVQIRITDYAADRCISQDVEASRLQQLLQSSKRPDWAACRWVYVNGISGHVVRTLGQAYGLHPLTLEDVMNTDNLAKVDWYDDHCFLELTMQRLEDVVEHTNEEQKFATLRSSKRFTYASNAVKDADLAQQLERPRRHLYQRFNMSVEQVSIYLTADKTVITIFERSGEDIFKPIFTRLQSPHTVLRTSNDPSMLVQGVVDAIVDLAKPIGKAFEDAFTELELAVLTRPSITMSRQVYVLRAGLASFLDLLVPMGGLVRTMNDHRNLPRQPPGAGPAPTELAASAPAPDFANSAISPLTQAYLNDVQDHITTLTSSTHMRIRSAENLSSLIFNTIAAKQNESVRQLTLVSIFFLPLTFLTGYFGMNFDPMPVVQENSDAFFWWIATPVMGVTLAMLMARSALRGAAGLAQLSWLRRSSRRPS